VSTAALNAPKAGKEATRNTKETTVRRDIINLTQEKDYCIVSGLREMRPVELVSQL
jgi:hypothetical protein